MIPIIVKVHVGVTYQAMPKAEADNPYWDRDYAGHHKNGTSSALQAAIILVAMASEKNIWWLKFWPKLPIGDQQILKDIYLEN